ncbi:heme biosynthesis protein HemY [Paracoccus onubensis]|uniref:Heme biosynthesis protein HemY n=1 Tax=Paracoccus onubensis TaxID=1675788 RepID=A0A418SMR3_9RHOB|nr:heme biosynthesis HemY N-terminal domain-containing protein [Paracoccus onubensis]RJE82256.1 heme biosynthesis protein HemY [Paracoccus onubensis]
MFLSLLKILFFFAAVLAIALGAIKLSETAQPLFLEYAGTEIMLTPVKAVVALLVLMVLAWLVFKLLGLVLAFLRFLAGDETSISRYFTRSRERKGYDALGEGMLAIASGEGKLALDKAAKAEKFLDRPHITNLLTAQAAEVAGDTARANATYRKLLEDERTRFVGIRGLMKQKLDEGDTKSAMLLAQKAYAIKPKHKELQNTLLELQTREHDWKGARATLKDKRRQGELTKDVAIRRDAVLALQEASEVLSSENSVSAREAAISAAKASPDLIPAAVLAARGYIAQKNFRNATRILEKTWSVRPHPDIAAAYAEIVPDETPNQRLRRFDALLRKNPDHEESRLLKAELLLAAEDFPGARRALGDLAQAHPTVRTLSIMAAVERGEGADDSVVRGWLARALTASRGPQWVCDKCHNIMSNWAPVCDSCGGFDTLTWREPEMKDPAPATSGAEMLPLLVGPVNKGGTATSDPAAIADADAAVSDSEAPQQKPEAPAKTEIADVAPGMVPREEDYVDVDVDPSVTVTTRETSAEAGSGDESSTAPDRSATDRKDEQEAEFTPVRPDVEPPDSPASGRVS